MSSPSGGPAPPNVNDLLLRDTEVSDLLFSACIATLVDGVIVTSILFHARWYFSGLGASDPRHLQVVIALGTMICVSTVFINCAAVYRICHSFEDYSAVFKVDMTFTFVQLVFGMVFSMQTTAYCAWRAWRLSGRQWWLVVVGSVAVLGILCTSIPLLLVFVKFTGTGSIDVRTLMLYGTQIRQRFQIRGGVVLGCEATICIVSIFYLVKTKSSIFHSQERLWKRLVSLMFESMLPPVICLVVLEASSGRPGPDPSDYRRIFITALPVLYFHSLLHSLVARNSIRSILDENLAEQGVVEFSSSSGGGQKSQPHNAPVHVYKGRTESHALTALPASASTLQNPTSSFGTHRLSKGANTNDNRKWSLLDPEESDGVSNMR